MNPAAQDDVGTRVLKTLENTPFASSSLKQLSGGTANYIYRATLVAPLQDGTTEVLAKHGEDYIKDNPDFKLTLLRCRVEEECLKSLSDLAVIGETDPGDEFSYIVKTPRVFHFDEGNNTQIQEYLTQGIDLKTYVLNTYPAHTNKSLRPQCYQLGKALGRWLRNFHGWSAQQPGLRQTLSENKEIQQLKQMINFGWLLQRVEQYPAVLGHARPIFEEVRNMAALELENEDELQIIHGDFWTGKQVDACHILRVSLFRLTSTSILIPNTPIQSDGEIPVFVIDWEMAQLGVPSLDLGQMIAELYELWLYKSIDAGLWMIQGLTEAYGIVSADFAFRIAIQVGTHLISFGTSVQGWGSPEQVEVVARTGRDLVVHAWKQDRAWSCFATYVGYKTVKRLEVLERETRGRRLPTRPQRYLLGLSRGLSSTALLHIMHENARQQRERQQRQRFELLVVHVANDDGDEHQDLLAGVGSSSSRSSGSSARGESGDRNRNRDREDWLDRYRVRFPGTEIRTVDLSSVLRSPTVDWAALPDTDTEEDANMSPSRRLARLFGRLPSATSRADIRRLLTRHVLLAAATEHACDALLLGYNTTSLAELTLSETAKGRGFSLPWQINDGAFPVPGRLDLPAAEAAASSMPVYHPLREVFRKELDSYTAITAPPLTELLPPSNPRGGRNGAGPGTVISHKDLSIDDVMARYFGEVEQNYPSVVANVVRTTGKLNRAAGGGAGELQGVGGRCGICGVALDTSGDERWRGEIGEEMDGTAEGWRGSLCYGCEKSRRG
ncbi:hypothetical protein DL764_000892 [Monosporascus ibericus]|uniref:Cytoplasmic tRNA 2-thiolation protein 2 n=1 Tax=Monosporascus ibericus TaxID=155417 RepID=A0A4Q4TRY7_9PEZI|nr:hypothetical protein DL764_000892 [Monosporascus ibericus]